MIADRSPADRRQLLIGIALATVAIGALLIRVVSIAEPLGIDQSFWASAVRGMSRGQLLYRDVWEQRPPGIYFTYLAAFKLFGWTPAAIAWLDLIASAATTGLVYLIVRRLGTSIAAGVAAALFAALTMPAWLYGHAGFLERSVCETFIVVCVGLGAISSVKFRESGSWIAAAGIGLFSGAAIVYKPNAGLYLIALLLWTLLYRREASSRAGVVRLLAIAGAAAAIAPALTILWLARHDLLREASIAVVDFNRYYVSEGFRFSTYTVDFSKAIFLRMKTEPLWLGGGIGSLALLVELARRRRLSPLAGLAMIWGGAAALVIIVNGARLFNTYFIQALPPLSILIAWLFVEHASGSALRRSLGVVTAALMLFVMVQRGYGPRVATWAMADLDALRGRVDRAAYLDRFGGYDNERGFSARANDELATYVRAHTSPDDRIFLFGISGAGVYFGADRLTAHRFLRVNFFVATEFPDRRFRLNAVIDELEANPPRYLIFERLNAKSEMGKEADTLLARPEIQELLETYRLDTRIEDFTLYERLRATARLENDLEGRFLPASDRRVWKTSGLSALIQCRLPERGARIARREEREYWRYLSDEQRREAGCPARQAVVKQRGQATSSEVVFPQGKPQAAISDETQAVSEGWAALAAGDAAKAAKLASDALTRHPRSAAVVALAIEVEIARGGAVAGLDAYEKWLGDRKVEDPYVVRRVARAALWTTARGKEPVALDAMKLLAEDGDADARAELTRRMYAGTGNIAPAKALASIDDGAVRYLIQALKTASGSKLAIVDALVASHSKLAIPPLVDLLSDTAHPDHVLAAADGLGRLGARQAIPALQPLVKNAATPTDLRWAASAALFKLGDFTGRVELDAAAKSDQAARRLAAAEAMSSRPDATWQSAVRALTKDPNATIRIEAAKLIAPYDGARARATLEPELVSTNATTRTFASQTLAQSPAADVATLRKLLRSTDTLAQIFAASHVLVLTR